MSSYPPAPSWRLSWDRDGTEFGYTQLLPASTFTKISKSNEQILNREDGEYAPISTSHRWVWVFPQPMDIEAFFFSSNNASFFGTFSDLRGSPDTTDGMNGTWNQIQSTVPGRDTVQNPGYRELIQLISDAPNPENAEGIAALAVTLTSSGAAARRLRAMHIYGKPSSPPDGLQLWHPTSDERLGPAALDWGDVPRDTANAREFRVKNLSPSNTATDIVVSMQALRPTSPSIVGQHDFSDDNATFNPTVTIPSLSPGQISPVLWLRRTIDEVAQLGLVAARVIAVPTTWG